jgi:hypothetical protein
VPHKSNFFWKGKEKKKGKGKKKDPPFATLEKTPLPPPSLTTLKRIEKIIGIRIVQFWAWEGGGGKKISFPNSN